MVAGHRAAQQRIAIEHLLAAAGLRQDIGRGHDEAVPRLRGNNVTLIGAPREQRDHPGIVWQVDHQAQGLAHAAPAGQGIGRQRIEAAIGSKDHQLVGGFGMQRHEGAVAVLELDLCIERLMALHRADPAHFRQDHGDRLALDHRIHVDRGNLARLADFGAAQAAGGGFAELAARLAQFFGDAGPLRAVIGQHGLQGGALGGQVFVLAAQFHFFKAAQGAQAHVQDRLDLHIGQLEFGDHHRLGIVLIADDLDHAVEVQEGNHIAFQHLEPGGDLFQPVVRASHQHLAPVVEEGAQHLFQRADLGHATVDQHVHVQPEADLKVRDAEQRRHQLLGVDVAGTRFQDDADILGGFVAHIGKDRHFLGLDDLGQTLDQLGFLHLIGDLGDDDLPATTAQILDRPARAQAQAAASGAVGFGDGLARFDQHAAGREIRAGDDGDQRVVARIRRLDQMQAGVDDFVQIMGRHVGRHADRDARGAIAQKVRKGRRQHDGFFQRAVIVRAEIDGILGQPLHQGLGGGGQTGLGVAGGGGVVAVDIAEIALTVDQRIAHGKGLRQTRHGIIDRRIAMRVIVAHHVAGDLGRFAERPGRRQAQLAHRVKDAAMHGLEPIAGIGQRTVHDRRQRIGQVTLANGARQRFGAGLILRRIGNIRIV